MNKRLRTWTLILAMLFVMPLNVASASTETNVLQVYISGQTMTVFTDGELLIDGLSCNVANQSTEITAVGSLADEAVIIKTTILVDISTSMPKVIRDRVITTLKKLIEGKSINEEFRIVVFGDELHTLQDFSSDRYDLAIAVDKIEFNGTQSRIYDAIYNTIPLITKIDEMPAFYRTIVITDGVDDTVSGITKEELYIKLQSEYYPVDVVAVSSKEAAENKELAAIVRMSGGRYHSLNPNTDTATLADALKINNYFYFESTVPSALLDGTTRQVDISDGVSNISIDVKFPVFNAPIVNTQEKPKASVAATPSPTAASLATISPLTDQTDAPKPISNSPGSYAIVIFIGAGIIALFIIIAIITAIAVARGKKSKAASRFKPVNPAGHEADSYAEKTEFVGDMNYTDSQYTIKLSNANDPSKTWTLPVTGELLIGRAEHCPMWLDDKSVSREQCKLMVKGNDLIVVHIGLTNKTSLNGSNVVESAPIQSGDTLKFGRVILRIDYIQTLGSPPPKPETPQNQKRGNTESIF